MPFQSVTNPWSYLCSSSSQWNTAWAISPKMNMLQLWCKINNDLLSKWPNLRGRSKVTKEALCIIIKSGKERYI